MRVNSITTENKRYLKGRSMEPPKHRKYESEKRHNLEQNNNDQINTTIKSNSDGRVSFSGGTPLLHRAANFTSDNPLVMEALFAILITCGLRPISIMATAKSEEDKDKCKYQAAKSISSGLMGLGLTALVGTPVAAASKKSCQKGAFDMPQKMKEKSLNIVNKGVSALNDLSTRLSKSGEKTELVETITNLTDGGKFNLNIFNEAGKNAEKIFKNTINETAPEISQTVNSALREQRIMNNYSKTSKNIIDKLFQPLVLPLRAKITIAMVPILLGVLGIKKASSNKQQNINTLNYNVFRTDKEKELFESFTGIAGSNENK